MISRGALVRNDCRACCNSYVWFVVIYIVAGISALVINAPAVEFKDGRAFYPDGKGAVTVFGSATSLYAMVGLYLVAKLADDSGPSKWESIGRDFDCCFRSALLYLLFYVLIGVAIIVAMEPTFVEDAYGDRKRVQSDNYILAYAFGIVAFCLGAIYIIFIEIRYFLLRQRYSDTPIEEGA